MKRKFGLTTISLLAIAIAISCNKNNTENTEVKYYKDVKKIINNSCMNCHSSTSGSWQGQPIKFDNDSDIVAQYEFIKSSVADPASPRNRRMPMNDTLSARDVDTIVKWYTKGGNLSD